GIEYRLRRIQKAEAVRPAVVVRASVSVLTRDVEPIRRVVRRPRAPLVLAIFGDEQAASEHVTARREAKSERVAGSPGKRLDGRLRVARVEFRPQDRPIADTGARRALERLDGGARPRDAVGRIAAGLDALAAVRAATWAGGERILTQRDVLTRDVLLV